MKGVDIFCASHAATAICLSMEPSSSSSPASATLLLGSGGGSGRAIDRHNPIINSKRIPKPTTSNPHSKKKKDPRNILSDQNENQPNLEGGKTRAAANDARKSWSCTKPGDFLSPPGSTRYLLRDKVHYNTLPDSEENSDKDVKIEEQSPSSLPPQQVVVLRVSLHCRGCERKLRKHLSRMEGVTSFEIDFAAKKVTVVGSVTPLDVVSSISKVKNAQLWPPTISASSENKNHDYKMAAAQI